MTFTDNFTKRPLVSIIMPVYNAGSYLSLALNSVLNQTYENFEIIVIDDASTDNSFQILKGYKEKFPQKITLVRNKRNMGVAYSSNKAIDIAKGDFIARMDSDDLMFQDRLENQVNFLVNSPDHIFVGGQVVEISEGGEFLGERKYPLDNESIYKMFFIFMSVLQGASMINKKKLPKDFTWYRSDLRVAEDMDLFFRLFKYGKFANLQNLVLSYRRHPFSISRRTPKETFALANKCRLNAVLSYGYKSTMTAWLMFVAQNLAVWLLPTDLIIPLYAKIRGIKLVDKKAKTATKRLNIISLSVL